MKYFLVCGRLPDFSIAEFEEVNLAYGFATDYKIVNEKLIIFESEHLQESLLKVFHRFGGFVRFGKVYNDLEVENLIELETDQDKFKFGVSSFNPEMHIPEIKKFANNLKKIFKSFGKKTSFVLPKQNFTDLAVGQIAGQRLLEGGLEICLLPDNQFGVSIAIPDIKAFAMRDYEKPYVDKKMGVIPVKLARMMINMAGIKPGQGIWDPFCGSGNILLEALDQGYNAIGTDISRQAINDSTPNIDWYLEATDNKTSLYSLMQYDVVKDDIWNFKKIKSTEFDAVVFEPFMGKPQRRVLNIAQAKELLEETETLFQGVFRDLEHLGRERLRVVCVLPSYKTNKGWVTIKRDRFLAKKWQIIRKDLHWSRDNSIIRRDIYVFELNWNK